MPGSSSTGVGKVVWGVLRGFRVVRWRPSLGVRGPLGCVASVFFVRVGPARRVATNKSLKAAGPVVCDFSRARGKSRTNYRTLVFLPSLRSLVKKKNRGFRHEQFFGPGFSLVNATHACKEKNEP